MNCPRCGIEVRDHPANNCLNEWVAIAVMGWTKGEDGFWRDDAHQGSYGVGYTWDEHDWDFVDFEPSTDISAAFEVMEKIGLSLIPVENKWFCGLWDDDYFDIDLGSIDGYFGGGYTGMNNIRCVADTAPLAISRASILAAYAEIERAK